MQDPRYAAKIRGIQDAARRKARHEAHAAVERQLEETESALRHARANDLNVKLLDG